MKARKKNREGGGKDLLLARGGANVLGHFDDERQCVDCALAYRAHAVNKSMLIGQLIYLVIHFEYERSRVHCPLQARALPLANACIASCSLACGGHAVQ